MAGEPLTPSPMFIEANNSAKFSDLVFVTSVV
jgi:hypothetical protein